MSKGSSSLLLLAIAAFGACAPEVAPVASPRAPAASTVSATTFADWEARMLSELAAVDPRLALRLRIQPSDAETGRAALAAILAGDPGLRVHARRADLFSFDARARGLAAIAQGIASGVSSPPRGSKSDEEEAQLFARLVAEERARVDEERQLPRSASELVRGLVATWTDPARMADLKEHDAWLGARIDDVRGTLGASPSLDATEVTELEDALDPLERLANPSGYPDTQGAIARLRVALAASHPVAHAGLGWEALHARLALHLGVADAEAALRDELDRTEARLRAEVKAAAGAGASEAEAKAAEKTAGESLLATDAQAALVDGGTGASRVRGIGPPPERRLVRPALRAIVAAPRDAAGDLRTLLALHDAVAVASWSFAMHVDGVPAEEASSRRGLMSAVPPERRAHLVRLAAVRPVECLAVARMAALVDAGGAGERRARAEKWLAYGDAPLDVVARDLGWAR